MPNNDEVIQKLEELVKKYPMGAAVIPWGEIRDELIRLSEKLKQINGYVAFLQDGSEVEPAICVFCSQPAVYEGYYRQSDATGQMTGPLKLGTTCRDHSFLLIGVSFDIATAQMNQEHTEDERERSSGQLE